MGEGREKHLPQPMKSGQLLQGKEPRKPQLPCSRALYSETWLPAWIMEVKDPWAGTAAAMESMMLGKQGEASAVSLGVEGRGTRALPLGRDAAVWAWGPRRGKGTWRKLSLSFLPDVKAACSNCPFHERIQRSRERWWA